MTKELLADVLRDYLEKTDNTAARLARKSGVPKRTLARWLSGDILHPYHWQPLVQVAVALELSETGADRLLQAAGKDAIHSLRRAAQTQADRALFKAFDAPSSHTPAPFMAPSDMRQFVGRVAELAELKAALLREGCAAICDVSRMGGVGKSALAAHAAYQLRSVFPDGVLWARLDASDSMTVLHQWARQLGGDVSQYRDLESRAAEVRALLAHKRVLLVLDNAENSRQVRPLLPPSESRCAVIVTTRNNGLTATDGWTKLTLHPFAADSGESLRLLEKYLGETLVRAHGAALTEIANLLGHLPLALAIVAGRLSTHVQHASRLNGRMTLEISVVLTELREVQTRLRTLQRDDYDVQASFELSYAALAPELKRFFVRLSVFGGEDFSLEAVAHVNEVNQETAKACLKELHERSLVQPSVEGRYRLHPLWRDYACEKMSNVFAMEQQARAYDRMVAYFVNGVGPSSTGKTPLPDADRSNVWEALRAISKQPWVVGLSAERTEVLSTFLQQRDAAARVEPHLRRAIEYAEAAGDLTGSLTLQRHILYMMWWRGEDPTDVGQQLLIRALERDHPVAFSISRLLGMFARLRGDYVESRAYCERSLALARRTNQTRDMIQALVGLGALCRVLADYDTAEKLLKEAEQLILIDTDLRQRIATHQQLGLLRAAQGRLEEAVRRLDESIALARQIGRDDMLLGALGDRADVALMDGNVALDVARVCASESLDISRRMGFTHGVSDALERLGKCATLQGDWSVAQKYLDEALQVATKANISECKASVHFALAELSLATGDVSTARNYAQASLSLYGTSHPLQSAKIRRWLSELQ